MVERGAAAETLRMTNPYLNRTAIRDDSRLRRARGRTETAVQPHRWTAAAIRIDRWRPPHRQVVVAARGDGAARQVPDANPRATSSSTSTCRAACAGRRRCSSSDWPQRWRQPASTPVRSPTTTASSDGAASLQQEGTRSVLLMDEFHVLMRDDAARPAARRILQLPSQPGELVSRVAGRDVTRRSVHAEQRSSAFRVAAVQHPAQASSGSFRRCGGARTDRNRIARAPDACSPTTNRGSSAAAATIRSTCR